MGWIQNTLNKISIRTIGVPIIISGGAGANAEMRKSDIVGSIAHCISTHVGKLQPSVVRLSNGKKTIVNDSLSSLLSLRPNREMTTYDFLYRMASDLVYTSNAFAVVLYDDDFISVKSIVPVTVKSFEIFEDLKNELYFRFQWDYDSKEYTLPYNSVLHLKSRFNKKRFLGTSPSDELQRSVGMLETTYCGVESSVKNSSTLRGYLQYTNHIKEAQLKEKIEEFKKAYLNAENNGGIAGVDETLKFVPLNQQSIPIPTPLINFFRDNIYRYYNISDSILMSKYTESEWNAFYESVIEPIALMLSQEFTYKLFSDRERGFGNKIEFNSNRLQYATYTTRQSIAGFMYDRGMMTVNEVREIMYLPLLEKGGDERMISLNYVNVKDQSKYQIGEKKPDEQAVNINDAKGGDEE